MARKKELSDDIIRLLKTVVDECDKEDRSVRERQLRTWRRLKLMWEGFSNVWYSEVAHDWRIWDIEASQDTNQAAYDYPVNVFRAYLESIIAALSVTVPPVKCYPDDADSTLDLLTAKAGDKIAELIYRHNDVTLLWLHALFVYCTEGMVACYSYPKESLEYGSYERKQYDDYDEQHQYTTCANCGFVLEDTILNPITGEEEPNPDVAVSQGLENIERDEYMPDDDDAEMNAALNLGQELCPACMSMMDPELRTESFIVPRIVGVTTEPKARVCLEAYGGLNIKVPSYARRQSECPYLQYAYETHYGNAIEEFEHLSGDKELIDSLKGGMTAGSYDNYDEWARLSPQYMGEFPINVVTIKRTWLRPAAFNVLKNDDDIEQLKELFPDGVKVSMVNDCFGAAENEALDDCWTLTYNPLADYVHYDPLGLLLVSIQEITNDLLSLTIQTIEHGIGQTFADPGVLSFKAYNQTEVTPGGIFPAAAKSGKSLSEGFHEMKTATLSAEVLPFAQQIQSLGQLVTGALPSLFGGQLEGSETASEYSMSRAQALQRLQNTWKMFNIWWKTIFGKAIPMYIKGVQQQGDERDVKRNADGSFMNVFIRKSELEGEIGKVEIEANENLPLTWSQKKDIVMQLLQSANPEILAVLGAPENLPIIRDAIGLTDFFVPGEDEVEATYDDIKALLQTEPMVLPPDPVMMLGSQVDGLPPPPEQEVPSIQPDPDIDNADLRFRILRGWLQSEAGRQAKVDNEGGYRNVLLYAKAYKMLMMPPPMALAGNGAPPNKKPNQLEMQPEAPITGESNVSTAQ